MSITLSRLTRQAMASLYDYRASGNDVCFQIAMAKLHFVAGMLIEWYPESYEEPMDRNTSEEWW